MTAMKDEHKALMKKQYAEVVRMQKRIRTLVEESGLDMEIEPEPGPPETAEQMLHALNTVRTNLNILEVTLNDWDWDANGTELRTRSVIQADIDYDTFLLAQNDPTEERTKEEIQQNIAYDQMQLKRL